MVISDKAMEIPMTKKYHMCTPEEIESRKWGSRFCAIKVEYAPESTYEVPATAQEFIDVVPKMLPPSKYKYVEGMLMDALRTAKPKVFKDLQAIKDIKQKMKRMFGNRAIDD